MTTNGASRTSRNGFNLQTCARPNILALQPYRCARDDYKDDGTNVLLDANENAYGPGLAFDQVKDALQESSKTQGANSNNSTPRLQLQGLNRYPDPHQHDLKQLLCNLRQTNTHTSRSITPLNLFLGVGSDEAIDALIRCFCRPAIDKILTCPPTYGMYSVSACVNDVSVVSVPLDPENNFALRADAICEKLSSEEGEKIKIVYICSPGNPTATMVEKDRIQQLLEHPTWNGIVVVDEAYVDFASAGRAASFAEWVVEWPNLVVMQTLSKAFGLAGIRIGAAFASEEVAALLNNLKAPYNISSITSQLASQALQKEHLAVMQSNMQKLIKQRERMVKELPQIKGMGRFRGGFESNFLLIEVLDQSGKPCNETALKVYEQLAENRGVVVRFRGKEYGCQGCLRITVGTEKEVERFLKELGSVIAEVHKGKANGVTEKDEQAANDVLA